MDVRKLESLVIPERNLTCTEHRHKGVYVLSRDPLVVYIEGFLGEGEGKEIVELRYVNYFHIFSTLLASFVFFTVNMRRHWARIERKKKTQELSLRPSLSLSLFLEEGTRDFTSLPDSKL